MKRRHTLFALIFSLTLAISGGGVATAAPGSFGSIDFGSLGGPLTGGCSTELVDNNKMLGPQTLATAPPVGPQLVGYNRFAGLPPVKFLSKYAPGGSWDWPPKDGYVLKPDGQPDKSVVTLAPGSKRIDRYGPAFGRFLAPEGTAYAKRALPPENLVDTANPAKCNYHVYSVKKSFKVYTGPIAEAFGQPGGGIQYQVDQQLIDPAVIEDHRGCFGETGGYVNTQWLLCAGILDSVYP
ncbi:TNT domain-containing protein [Gordonia sp. CPCC 205515]|uniref:TNT domain-containing protein n=1 Tax=Gordonia sp. CPCC 205515 TaxID=3140791 RepID=UPI003AF37867